MKQFFSTAFLLIIFLLSTSFFSSGNQNQLGKNPPVEIIDFTIRTEEILDIQNPCTGELIVLKFITEFSRHGIINGNRANFTDHIKSRFDGIGQTSGEKYTGIFFTNIAFNTSSTNTQSTYNLREFVRLISSGNTPNFATLTKIHITTNPKGEVTIDRYDFEELCQ